MAVFNVGYSDGNIGSVRTPFVSVCFHLTIHNPVLFETLVLRFLDWQYARQNAPGDRKSSSVIPGSFRREDDPPPQSSPAQSSIDYVWDAGFGAGIAPHFSPETSDLYIRS